MTNTPTLPDLEHMARQAGKILHDSYEKDHEVSYKGVIDLVTNVDHASEDYILGEIQRLFPTHRILSEEAGGLDGHDEHLWLVDPIDGTVNYAHGVPFFSVSIAYAHKGIVTLGAVYDPMRDEMFTAERGHGSHLNGRALRVSTVDELVRSLMVTGFPYDLWTSEKNNLEFFSKFSRQSQGVRRLGSAALDLCYIGAGRIDGYWELSLKPWDLAAGGLIAEEAGARVTTLDGGSDYISPPCSMIACAPGIYTKMMEVFNS
jgi:myo-inositol-1(or 4)-monophosphatase